MNNRSWKDTVKKGMTISKPVYAAQIALYQAYMEPQIPGLAKHPALFTAVNKDTCELYFEQVPFDQGLAQRSSDKAVKIFTGLRCRRAVAPDQLRCRTLYLQNVPLAATVLGGESMSQWTDF